MGTTAHTLIATALVALCALCARADAEPCVATPPSGPPFATCFDPGNRVYASAASDGYGFAIQLRHRARTDDPDVNWRLEHQFASLVATSTDLDGVLYAGRFMRHSRDGHILLPLGPPRKVFVPFDIGAQAEVGAVRRQLDGDLFDVNVIRAAVLLEFTRSASFRRRLAIGPVTRWDMVVARDVSAVTEHRVTPFSAGALDAYLESRTGLTSARFHMEAGSTWSASRGWQSYLEAEASVERVILAINDQPISLYAGAGHERGAALAVDDANREGGRWRAVVGARFALAFARRVR